MVSRRKVILLTIFVNPKPKWPQGRVFRLTVDMVYHIPSGHRSLHCSCKTVLNINWRILYYIEMVRIKGDKSILPSLRVIKRDNNRGEGVLGPLKYNTSRTAKDNIPVISPTPTPSQSKYLYECHQLYGISLAPILQHV